MRSDGVLRAEQVMRLARRQGKGDEAHAGGRGAAQAVRAQRSEVGLSIEEQAVGGLVVEEVVQEVGLQLQEGGPFVRAPDRPRHETTPGRRGLPLSVWEILCAAEPLEIVGPRSRRAWK